MRMLIVIALAYAILFASKKIGLPSISAGVGGGFLAAILVNVAFYFIYGFQPMDVITIMFSICAGPLFGFFISNKVYGVNVQK